MRNQYILGMRVDVTTYQSVTDLIIRWAIAGESKYVCAANVHMTMEAHDSPEFREVVNGADLVVPDGMPLVWALRMLGCADAQRVRGPSLLDHVCKAAEERSIPVGFYGSTPETLRALVVNLQARYPELNIAYYYSPPFRPLTPDEELEVVKRIRSSGARILFVGLGCPKQERWMARQLGQIPAVMLGVGAAFDFHAGMQPEAPQWMQSVGLEWLFRLAKEPRRLWRRYLKHNPRFLAYFASQYVRSRVWH